MKVKFHKYMHMYIENFYQNCILQKLALVRNKIIRIKGRSPQGHLRKFLAKKRDIQ